MVCFLRPIEVRTETEERVVELLVSGVSDAGVRTYIGAQPVFAEPLKPI